MMDTTMAITIIMKVREKTANISLFNAKTNLVIRYIGVDSCIPCREKG